MIRMFEQSDPPLEQIDPHVEQIDPHDPPLEQIWSAYEANWANWSASWANLIRMWANWSRLLSKLIHLSSKLIRMSSKFHLSSEFVPPLAFSTSNLAGENAPNSSIISENLQIYMVNQTKIGIHLFDNSIYKTPTLVLKRWEVQSPPRSGKSLRSNRNQPHSPYYRGSYPETNEGRLNFER